MVQNRTGTAQLLQIKSVSSEFFLSGTCAELLIAHKFPACTS